MDIHRPELVAAKKRKRIVVAVIAAVVIAAVSLGIASLPAAAPSIERSAVVIDVVKRGPMIRQVRGTGTLVPENARWIAAQTDGRVERILIHAGSLVAHDSVIMELSNPEVEQSARDA